ncbi:MAG: hypothetical protein K1Y02_07765 [Candidatus Hydrogenedentes bacterium]|nr:hypothetical protein [Candidatus Hydrogenedentota bacterium]
MRIPHVRVLVLAMAAMAQVLALEVPLRYFSPPMGLENARRSGTQCVTVSQTPPPGEWKLPPMVARIPLFGLAKLGDAKHLIVLDCANPSDQFYTRFLFDANANRDLTDDPVVTGRCHWESDGHRVSMRSRQGIELDVLTGEGKTHYEFDFEVQGGFSTRFPDIGDSSNLHDIRIYLYSRNWYVTALDIDGTRYGIEIDDRNMNGRFGDTARIPPDLVRGNRLICEGDRIHISDEGGYDYYNEMNLTDKLALGDKLFKVQVDTAGLRLILTPITENLSAIKIPEGVERLVVLDANGSTGIAAFRPGKVLRVPAGEYRLQFYQLLRKDKEGDLWRLNANGIAYDQTVTATTGAEAVLAMGEPFRPVVKGRILSRDASYTGQPESRLAFGVCGKGNEMVTDLSRIRGNSSAIAMSTTINHRPKEPTYKVVSKDGEVVAQGQFEYG